MKRSLYSTFTLVACAILLAACSTLGLEKPQSAQDAVQYGKAVATGAYLTIEQNVGTSIPAPEARTYFNAVKEQRDTNIAAAQRIADSLPAGATSMDVTAKINLAVGALQSLLVELKRRYPTVKEVPPKLAP
jgi:hypothetical protein